jgi:hypothetical protein
VEFESLKADLPLVESPRKSDLIEVDHVIDLQESTNSDCGGPRSLRSDILPDTPNAVGPFQNAGCDERGLALEGTTRDGSMLHG